MYGDHLIFTKRAQILRYNEGAFGFQAYDRRLRKGQGLGAEFYDFLRGAYQEITLKNLKHKLFIQKYNITFRRNYFQR